MKIVDEGSAKPGDKIYSTGLTVGGRRMTQSTPPSTTDTDGAMERLKKMEAAKPMKREDETQEQFEERLNFFMLRVGPLISSLRKQV